MDAPSKPLFPDLYSDSMIEMPQYVVAITTHPELSYACPIESLLDDPSNFYINKTIQKIYIRNTGASQQEAEEMLYEFKPLLVLVDIKNNMYYTFNYYSVN